jgi:hypothetical protein
MRWVGLPASGSRAYTEPDMVGGSLVCIGVQMMLWVLS